MKKIISFLLLFLFVQGISAQDKNKTDKIKSLKIAHITTELNLTPAEAEKILPIYNTYCDKIYDLKHDNGDKCIRKKSLDDIKNMTEEEATIILQNIIKNENEYHLLNKNLINDLQKTLSNKRIIQFKKAEEDFNIKLFKQYRGKKK